MRRRHRGRNWLIALIVLIALLVAADRVAAAVTENQLASKIQTSQHLAQKPNVSISGFPFLTQVVSRDFGHATIDIHDLNAQGMPISHIHAVLNGVHVSSGYDSAIVDTLNGVASLTYSDVSKAVTNAAHVGQIALSRGSDGQVVASYKLLGVAITAHVSVEVLDHNVLEVKSTKIDTKLSGLNLDAPAGFDVKIPLSGLPFGMRLKDVQVTDSSVDIAATGDHVQLTGNSLNNG